MNYKQLLKQSVDLHVHVGPEIIPRKFTVPDLIAAEKNNLKAIGVKNHFFSTVSMVSKTILKQSQNFIIHSIVLNNYVGGFNAVLIRASAQLTPLPIIVWFPTLHAANFLKGQIYEIPVEWIDKKSKKIIGGWLTKNIKKLTVIDGQGNLRKEVKAVLQSIKDCGAILATGHLAWQESEKLVTVAVKQFGIKKIIITHPIYQKIAMPLAVQKKLAALGALIEQSFSMYSIDNIPIKNIVRQIKYVGARNCILSSDVGQTFSQNPSQALLEFIQLLEKQGVTEKEIKMMLITNPRFLINTIDFKKAR